MDLLIAGAAQRLAQAALAGAPTILIGFLTAAVIRRFVGYERTRQLFGGGSLRSLATAWVLGMMLPVCSLGSIPIAREMRKAGLSGGTVVAFALTAPLFNPISILYGLTIPNPMVIVVFSLCTLGIVTAVGLSWDYFFRGTESPEAAPPHAPVGWRRVALTTTSMVRESWSESTLYMALGLIGTAALSALLPHGSLQNRAESSDPWAPVFMSLVMVPAYITPMVAMVTLASMYQHGNSIGAAFTMLVFGAGANLGLVAWMTRRYGATRIAVWFVVVLALAYAVDKPLFPKDVAVVGHSHGFDAICCPFAPGVTDDPWPTVARSIREQTGRHEVVALAVWIGMIVAGAVLSRFDPNEALEKRLETVVETKTGAYDMVIPGSVLAGITGVSLVVLSIAGCYLFYPPPDVALKDLRFSVVELSVAARSRQFNQADYYTPIVKDLTRKVEVGSFLRTGKINEFRAAKAEVLIDKVEALGHAIAERDLPEVDRLATEAFQSYIRLRKSYGDLPPDSTSP